MSFNRRSQAVQEEQNGIIEFRVVSNDNTRENFCLLTELKNIFQRQLPKMPREYIAKLVYDPYHLSMCLIKKTNGENKQRVNIPYQTGQKSSSLSFSEGRTQMEPMEVEQDFRHDSDQNQYVVLGGICYRPFFERKFAEIVFCAITSTEQVKGYGSHLMNHLKDHVRKDNDIRHFLTYADNYAIGYFQKQGFTTEISLYASVWVGYIKDYEGGTIMQCTMVPKVRYLDVYDTFRIQKKTIVEKIQQISNSHKIHPGITGKMNPMSIPGVMESGWTPELSKIRAKKGKSPLYILFMQLIDDLKGHASAWPFMEPVDRNVVRDYYDVIKAPMDLQTLEKNAESEKYNSVTEFTSDVQKIFNNCRKYNDPITPYFKCANKLEKFFYDRLKVLTDRDTTGF